MELNRKKLPVFHPEFGRFMLESTPGEPWGIGFKALLEVEQDMKWRYARFAVFIFRTHTPIGESLRKTIWLQTSFPSP